MNTVNVLQMVNGVPSALHAFADDEEGNKKAESLFVRLINEIEGTAYSAGNLVDEIDDGTYQYGLCALYIVHSVGE